MAKLPSRIAVIAPDNVGDYLLVTPALRALKQGYPGARITLLASRMNATAAAGNPDLDELVEVPKLPVRDYLKWALAYRARKFDMVVCLPANVRKYFLAWLLGGNLRLGIYYRKMWVGSLLSAIFLTHRISSDIEPSEACLKKLQVKHELEQYLDIIAALGLKFQDTSIVFTLEAADKAFAAQYLAARGVTRDDTLVALQYSDRWFTPELRTRKLASLLQALQQVFPAWKFLLLFTTSQEEPEVQALISTADSHRAFMAGALPLKHWAALISNCRYLISMEGGAPLMAGALQVPVLAVYFNLYHDYLIQRWHPWGAPYRLLKNPDFPKLNPAQAHDAAQALILDIIKEFLDFTAADTIQALPVIKG